MSSDRFSRIKEILSVVEGLSASERAVYLERVFESAPALQEEIESLLAHEHDGDAFPTEAGAVFRPRAPRTEGSTGPLIGTTPSSAVSSTSAEPGLASGTLIGSYEILEEIGRGGMGLVYRARSEGGQKDCALKILPPASSRDPASIQRFASEARLLASLNHPNIATIHTVEQFEDIYFLTMELVEGSSLATHLGDGPVSLPEALTIARQVASALEAAHARGVVHRDIKPLNVMVGGDQHVKVLDFGIAKAVRGEESWNEKSPVRDEPGVSFSAPDAQTGEMQVAAPGSKHSAVAGTPGYVSPERLKGGVTQESADIWSLGCLFYECLVGRLPFRGTTMRETLRATLEAEPLLEDLPDSAPPSIHEFLRHCLAKDPTNRFPSMRTARRTIETILASTTKERGTGEGAVGIVSARTNLPRRLTTFVGREEEITEINAALIGNRFVTLTGIGGCGKTRLSLEVADGLADRYTDGAWQIELASVAQTGLVPDTVRSTLGLDSQPGKSALEVILAHLENKKALLLLDNCEHVRGDCASLLAQLIPALPTLHILATSREPIGLPEERVYSVPPMAVPAEGVARGIESLASVRLFCERALRVGTNIDLETGDSSLVAEICRRLDGIPLAIELAAARLRNETLAETLAGLDEALGTLKGGNLTTLPRHQTLRGVIDWSYERLEPREQMLFRRLSVFAAEGWTSESAEEVCTGEDLSAWEVSGLTGRLLEKSLFSRVETTRSPGTSSSLDLPRFRLLATVRTYAAERLEHSQEAPSAREKHHRYYLDLAELAEPHLEGEKQKGWINRLEKEQANLVQALEWSASQPDGPRRSVLPIIGSLYRVWSLRGQFELGRSVLRRFLSNNEGVSSRRERAHVRGYLGNLNRTLGDGSDAQDDFQEALSIYRELDDDLGIAHSFTNLGEIEKNRGHVAEARRYLEQSRDIYRRENHRSGLASTLTVLGNLYDDVGDNIEARESYEKALQIYRELGRPNRIADLLLNVGGSAWDSGDEEGALSAYEESLAIRRDLGNRPGIATCLNNLGIIEEARGNWGAAYGLYNESLSIKRELGNPRAIISSLANLGHLLEKEGKYERGRVHCEEAVRLSRKLGRGRALSVCLGILGGLESRLENFEEAQRYQLEALEIRREMGDEASVSIALHSLGECALGSGQLEKAHSLFSRSMQIRCDVGMFGRIAEQLETSAWLEIVLGDAERAPVLFGASTEFRAALGRPLENNDAAEFETRVSEAKRRLGENLFTRRFEEGRRLGVEAAIGLVLNPSPVPPAPSGPPSTEPR